MKLSFCLIGHVSRKQTFAICEVIFYKLLSFLVAPRQHFIHSFTFNSRLKAHAVEYNGKSH